VDNRL
jgi:hypothetical protein